MDTPVAQSTNFKIVGPEGGEFFWQPVPANGFIRNILSQAATGADANFSIGTQTVAPRCFVREHTHAREEEIIVVLEGRGVARIDGVGHPLEKGSAVFVDKQLQSVTGTRALDGRALDAGVGFDRRSGDYRVFGSVIVHREWSTAGSGSTSPAEPHLSRTHVNLVASIDRPFARDRYFVRGFGVVNPGDGAGFVRALFVWKVRDDVTVEGSAAAFLGTSDDTLGRFQDRDFVLMRLRYRW